MAKKSKAMTDADIVKNVGALLRAATGFDEDEVLRVREEALDYYFMRKPGLAVAGRSDVVSGDLSAMVEAVLAEMLDAFSGENIAEFHPDGAGDEDQAQLESDTVNDFVMGRNNGFIAFLEAIKDALIERNGIIKVWVDERRETETRSYTQVDPIAFTKITTEPGKEIDVVAYDPEAQTLKIKETTVRRKLRLEARPLENFMYTENWTSLDLQDIPFCAERIIDSRSAMIEQGFNKKLVNELATTHESKQSASARNPRKKETDPPEGNDASQDQIEYFECYVLIDTDGDGISERRQITISGTTLLDNIEVPLVAFAAGAVLINSHRFLGISLHDKLKQIQDINTALERGLLDNVNASNKSRLLTRDGKVNQDDVEDGRVNGQIRIKKSHSGPLNEAVQPLVVPDISAGILANIEHQKQSRAELGGAALDLSAGNAQLGSEQIGSQGLDRAYSVMEGLAEMMTRICAATLIRSVYLLTHATLRENFDKPVSVKRSAGWDTPTPTEWVARERVTVKPGMSAGERSRRVTALGGILEKQQFLAENGLEDVLVNMTGFHAAIMDWSRASEVQNPEQYFLDPTSDESKAALVRNQEKAKQAQAQQAALLDQALGLERLRTAFDKYKQDTELQFKYWADNLKSEIQEAIIVGSATTALEVARTKPKGAGDGATDEKTATD